MIYKVYHAKEPNFRDTIAPDYPSNFEHIADVESDSLGQVFPITNHIDHDWTENKGVTVVPGKRYRSTSIGDVVVDPDGTPNFCAATGWWKMIQVDGKWVIKEEEQ